MLPVQDEAEGAGSVLSGNYTVLHKCFNGMIVGNYLCNDDHHPFSK